MNIHTIFLHHIGLNLNYNKCMRLIRFFAIIENIIIVIIVLCSIPTLIFVYLPNKITLSQDIQNSYQIIYRQTQLSGYLLSMKSNVECTQERLALMNDYCMNRCTMGSNCTITSPTTPCTWLNSYVIGSNKFCSLSTIGNSIIKSDTPSFAINTTLPPLASITMNINGYLIPEYYCLKNIQSCSQLTSIFNQDITHTFSDNYDSFKQATTYMMYFGLIPLVAHIIIALILDHCCKFNLRMTNSLMIGHLSLIEAGIIVCGILFTLNDQQLTQNIGKISSNCIMNDIPVCQSLSQPFSNFSSTQGISSFFIIFMSFILAVQILGLIGIVIINVLMVKYYHLREIEPSSSGYELQSL